MTPDRIESMLRTEGVADEVAFRARPLPATIAGARARLVNGHAATGLQRFAMAAVAAVAVLAVSVLAATWIDTLREEPSIGASDTPDPSSAPTNTPAAIEGDAGCRAADFTVTSDAWDAGAGARGTHSVFRVVDSVAQCTLPATISARITDASGNVLVEGTADPEAESPVISGDALNLEVSWSNWCGPGPERPLSLEVVLADDDTAVRVDPPAGSEILVPPCLGGGEPSVLNVVGFQR